MTRREIAMGQAKTFNELAATMGGLEELLRKNGDLMGAQIASMHSTIASGFAVLLVIAQAEE